MHRLVDKAIPLKDAVRVFKLTCRSLNLASKELQTISMMHVMVDVYCMDKAVVMEYQASQEGHIETGNII